MKIKFNKTMKRGISGQMVIQWVYFSPLSFFALVFLLTFLFMGQEVHAGTWKLYGNLINRACGTENPAGSGNWVPTSSVGCPSGSCTNIGEQRACGSCSCSYNIPRCVLSSTAECEDDSGGTGGGGGSLCGSAAKSYSYTDTAYSGTICRSGSSPTTGNGSVPFPAQGETVSWDCANRSSPTSHCSATRGSAPVSVSCGSADGGTFPTSGPPSANRCINTTQTNFAFRYQGSYWNGWTWNCGSNSCSANLSPGICGSANGTTRASAPSTTAERCSAGVSSSVSGSGPWSWSCSGWACSANKTASCVSTGCNNHLYCTGTAVYDNCGTYCGSGTKTCTTPRIKVCPTLLYLNSGDVANFELRYWANSTAPVTCSNTGYSTVTSSSTWSTVALPSPIGSILTVSNVSGSKGRVTAGSVSQTATQYVYADYAGLRDFGPVTVSPAGAASCTISPVDLGGGSYRMDYTINWGSATYTLMGVSGAGAQPNISKTGATQSGSFTHTPTATTTYRLTPLTGFSPGPGPLCEATVTLPSTLVICSESCGSGSSALSSSTVTLPKGQKRTVYACYGSGVGDSVCATTGVSVSAKWAVGDSSIASLSSTFGTSTIITGQSDGASTPVSAEYTPEVPSPLRPETKNDSVTISVPGCVASCSGSDQVCSGQTYTDSCGNANACQGTRDCSSGAGGYKEVAP
ncbi:MAG: hypothetical protein KC736_02260 [Candidatus Moranbacteria bacterium]|nr:hypothetical protein [Candidatus Moranbacteria bacterium]